LGVARISPNDLSDFIVKMNELLIEFKQREKVAKLALSLKPIANPGEKAVYSNVGWVIPEEGSLLSVADGSGGTFYARVIVFPPLNAAFAGFTNCGDGYKALDKVIKKIAGFNWKT
jgi:hypothetical protein